MMRYGIYRQIIELGQGCMVVAPSLISRKPRDRIKTDRRDAAKLAVQHRSGDLTAVWVPDEIYEAMRDLVRARIDAVMQLMRARQQLLAFLLRHGRTYTTRKLDAPASQMARQPILPATGAPDCFSGLRGGSHHSSGAARSA